jgi:hypothetical protein
LLPDSDHDTVRAHISATNTRATQRSSFPSGLDTIGSSPMGPAAY